jgi:signal transduction histidine kinase
MACGCNHRDAFETVRRDLHDQIGSPLAGLIMEVELARQLIKKKDAESAYAVLTDTRRDLVELMSFIRRLCSRHEGAQQTWDMEKALRTLLGRMNRAVAHRLVISLDADPQLRSVPDDVGRGAFWIIREAVTNVIKHSTAMHCTVTLRVRNCGLEVLVSDDGTISRPPRIGDGSGLSNMKVRAHELGGRCIAKPISPHGFVVSAFLPTAPQVSVPAQSPRKNQWKAPTAHG